MGILAEGTVFGAVNQESLSTLIPWPDPVAEELENQRSSLVALASQSDVSPSIFLNCAILCYLNRKVAACEWTGAVSEALDGGRCEGKRSSSPMRRTGRRGAL